MSALGIYLRYLRKKSDLSLKDVQNKISITNSKLSRLENDSVEEPSPNALKQLANLYGVNVITLYLKAGYLNENNLLDYTKIFRGVDLLTEEEINHIQEQIDLFIKRSERGSI